MAAYRTAARLFPGLHLPLLGMGMEYQRMNNLALAEQLFKQGHAICPADPLLCNELGVLAYRNNHYQEAEQWLNKALDRLPDNLTPGNSSCSCIHWYHACITGTPPQSHFLYSLGADAAQSWTRVPQAAALARSRGDISEGT